MRRENLIIQVGADSLFQLFLEFNGAFAIFPPGTAVLFFSGIVNMAALLHLKRENVSPERKTVIFIYNVHEGIYCCCCYHHG